MDVWADRFPRQGGVTRANKRPVVAARLERGEAARAEIGKVRTLRRA